MWQHQAFEGSCLPLLVFLVHPLLHSFSSHPLVFISSAMFCVFDAVLPEWVSKWESGRYPKCSSWVMPYVVCPWAIEHSVQDMFLREPIHEGLCTKFAGSNGLQYVFPMEPLLHNNKGAINRNCSIVGRVLPRAHANAQFRYLSSLAKRYQVTKLRRNSQQHRSSLRRRFWTFVLFRGREARHLASQLEQEVALHLPNHVFLLSMCHLVVVIHSSALQITSHEWHIRVWFMFSSCALSLNTVRKVAQILRIVTGRLLSVEKCTCWATPNNWVCGPRAAVPHLHPPQAQFKVGVIGLGIPRQHGVSDRVGSQVEVTDGDRST